MLKRKLDASTSYQRITHLSTSSDTLYPRHVKILVQFHEEDVWRQPSARRVMGLCSSGHTQRLNPHFNWRRVRSLWRCKDASMGSFVEDERWNAGEMQCTHWNSGTSTSKSTDSTPTRSSCSSTIDARSWSVASSMPRKWADGDLEGIYSEDVGVDNEAQYIRIIAKFPNCSSEEAKCSHNG